MSAGSIGKAYQQPIPIFSTKAAQASTKVTLTADTASNHALGSTTGFVSIKTAIDDIVYVKFKTAVGDADVTTSDDGYDDIILSGELTIDRDIFKKTENSTITETTHISIISATAGDVFIIEK